MSDLSHRLADLTPEQRELLLLRLRKKTGARPSPRTLEPIEPRPPGADALPLSFSQQRLWFLDQWSPGNSYYNVSTALVAEGELDVAILRRTLDEIVRRHESLRTKFERRDDQPIQVVDPPAPGTWPLVDMTALTLSRRQAEADRRAREILLAPFDLARGPLFRVGLLGLRGREHVLAISMHHIVSDGWSLGILIREFATLYQAFAEGAAASPLPELPIQYPDFALWQRRRFTGERLEAHVEYWRRQLAGAPAVHSLPSDRARPAEQTFTGAQETRVVPQRLSQELKTRAREHGVTLFMLLLAAFDTLLFRWSGQTDVVVGSPTAHRNRTETEGLIGFFVNTLALRLDLSGPDLTFLELLGRTRETVRAAFEHQDLPFEKLVEELKPQRDPSYSPIFQILMVLQNAPRERIELPGLSLRSLGLGLDLAKFDLMVSMSEGSEGLAIAIEYNSDLFDSSTVARLAQHFENLAASIADDPERALAELPLLGPSERHQLLAEWNDTVARFDSSGLLVPELVAARARADGNAVAVAWYREGEPLVEKSYGELDRQAANLARTLRRRGVGPDARVAVCLERSPDLVAVLLAVWKAGGAYVPLDPAHPRQRLLRLLEDSGAAVLVTEESLIGDGPLGELPDGTPELLVTDREADPGEEADSAESTVPSHLSPSNLAYVIYTSGSTGTPKGVQITHGNCLSMIEWAGATFTRQELGGVLASTSVTFDLSVFEFFATLSRGGRVILVDNAFALGALPAEAGVSLVNTVPSALGQLLASGSIPSSVETICLAGEAWPAALAGEIHRSAEVRLVNLYGPTEDSYTTLFEVPKGLEGSPPVGVPITGTRGYVTDRCLREVPLGVPGELCLGGDGQARGYHRRPALTAERFVPDPFSGPPGSRLYHSGDLVRYRGDAVLLYLGRIDHQVKVRGFRIELGEIEAALARHPAVDRAVVLAREDRPGDRRLVAYLTAAGKSAPEPRQLRHFLARTLPEYMVPAAFVGLDAMPLNPNGKIDRGRLPAPAREVDEGRRIAPRTPLEEQLALVWEDVLGVRNVSVDNDFFELGGHSLLATRVISRLRRDLRAEIPVRLLFEAPTLEEMASRIESLRRRSAGTQLPPVVPTARREEGMPPSFAQQRLWFLDRLGEGRTAYNLPVYLDLEGRLHTAALGAALEGLVARHETLRTTFAQVGGRPVQVIAPPGSAAARCRLPVVDLTGLPPAVRDGEARDLAALDAGSPFDLERGPLLRAHLVRLDEDSHLLLFNMHHVISDGWSMGILVREVAALYRAHASGGEPRLPPLPVQYADFAAWQEHHLSEILGRQSEYWHGVLAGAPEVLELAADRPRPSVRSFRGAVEEVRLPQHLAAEVAESGRRHGVSLFMTLLAALAALLGRRGGGSDVVVGTPIAGRNRLETENLIGFFVNTLVLRLELGRRSSFRELLERAREVTLSAYDHQDLPFERLVEELRPERSFAHSPLFQVMLILQNAPREAIELPGLTLHSVPPETGTAKFDLTLAAAEQAGSLGLALEYATDIFDRATARRLLGHFRTLLEGVTRSPEVPLAEISFLGPGERQQVCHEWNDTERSTDRRSLLVPELIAARASERPESVAVVLGRRDPPPAELRYRELEERSARLARALRKRGVGPEVTVGVCLERSLDLVIALYGIWKAGGAYVPLDPNHPRERLLWLLRDSGSQVLVTQGELAAESSLADLPESAPELLLVERLESEDATPLEPPALSPENLAYVIYTSGSTGKPKGVRVTHGNCRAFVDWAAETFTDRELGGVLASTSISFDLSVFELFVTLSRGGRAILVDNALALGALPPETGVSLVNTVPSAMAELLRTGLPPSVETINLAGEAWPANLAGDIHRQARVRLLNLYGPSEDTTYSTIADIPRGFEGPPPIGVPIARTRAWVLDRGLRLVPAGVPGELCLGGAGLARDYLRRPALSAEKFVPDPFATAPGSRLYRTGDLARLTGSGELLFLGRIDHQVKVRGFRIELGEIEAALARRPDVRQVVVTVREDRPGDQRLVAYLVPHGDSAPSVGALRRGAAEVLPDYMLPSAVVVMDELPLTPNGKVDRRRLPAPEGERPELERAYVAPEGPIEEAVAQIWCEILGVERVGVHDNFFELGGHSLLATQILSRIDEALNVEMPLRRFFTEPTVASVAKVVRELQLEESTEEEEDLLALVEGLSDEELAEKLEELRSL